MKMNRYYNIFAFVLVVLSYVSCSSDDKTDTPALPDEKEVLTDADSLIIRQQMAVVNILSKLTGRDDIGPDFDTKQYAPDYGSVRDEALPYVRAIAVADATEAENQFRALVGSHFVQTTADGLTVTLADMNLRTDGRRQTLGTLTFHRAINDERLAYADVAIDCMPALRRIEYIDEKNWGLNAGSPYMMGQLVYYGGSTYTTGLYVCVRTSTDGNRTGRLIHFETNNGTSDCSYNLDQDDEGCWVPYNHATATDMEFYMQLLLRNKRGYRNAISAYLKRSSTDERYRNRHDQVLPKGFYEYPGHLYGHNGDYPAAVILNAEYSSESEWLFGRRRKVTFWEVTNWSVSDIGEEKTMTYWKDKEWNSFMIKYYVLTANIIKFGSDEVPGAVKVYDPAPDAF